MTHEPGHILLADPHPLVCIGFRALLASSRQFKLLDVVTAGDTVQQHCREYQPNLLLLDPALPGPSTVEIITAVQTHCPTTRVLILTSCDDEATVRSLLAAGIAGYLLKDEAPEVLMQALERVAQGGTWFSQAIMAHLVHGQPDGMDHTAVTELTRREQQILCLLGYGWNNARIATELQLAEQTVRNYTRQIYSKLGVHSRAEAIIWVRERGIT